MYRFLSSTLTLLLGAGVACADNWPSWRGPHANGISDERNLPVTWSATRNVRWKVSLPERGNSTPVVWGERVFLTQSLDKGKRRAVLCFARADGKKLWQQDIPCTVKEITPADNPPCSSSPVTDGKAVYGVCGSAEVVAYDFHGKQLWHRDLGPLRDIARGEGPGGI